jgi:uncharacterized protein (DUF1330 family)
MNKKFNILLAVAAGAIFGAAAVQGLHAQAKPKAYQVTELEIADAAAFSVYAQSNGAAQQAAGGRNLRTGGGKVVALVGEAPKNVGIVEWDSLDQAVAWRNSKAFKDLAPQRDKAIKIIRQYNVEVRN